MTADGTTTAPPAPRRVRMGPTAWRLLRETAVEDPRVAHPDRLPRVSATDADEPAARRALVDRGVLTTDGDLVAPVRAGLRVLGSAPVTVVVERRTSTVEVWGRWASLGVPTAGIVVTRRLRGDAMDVEVELQLLAGDHLVTEIATILALPAAGRDDGDRGHADLLDTATSGHLPAPLDEVVVDGVPALHARMQLSGPAGTGVATIVGDGTRAWQLGAQDRTTLAWRRVDAPTVSRTLTSRLAEQLSAVGGRHGRW